MIWLTLKVFEKDPSTLHAPSWTHPLAELEAWNLRRPKACESVASLTAEIQNSTKSQIWFVDVQPQRGKWVLLCSAASTGDLFQRWQEGFALSPLLSLLFKDGNFVIFNIHASQKVEAENFVDLLKDYEKSSQVAVISPSRIPVETIRKKRPQWFFGSDRTSWTKVLTFSSLRLVGLVNAWADFYVLTAEDQNHLGSKSGLIETLLKREKVLIKETESDEPVEKFYKGSLPVTNHKD